MVGLTLYLHSEQGLTCILVLCHLINECGRLNYTDEALLQPYAEILARKVNAEVSSIAPR